jgi:glycosyltransferase involved in cell wall biosynthesis
VESEHVGVTFDPGSPRALADALSRLADHPAQVEEIKQRARQLALSRFNAEAQAPVLAAAWGA